MRASELNSETVNILFLDILMYKLFHQQIYIIYEYFFKYVSVYLQNLGVAQKPVGINK